MAAPRKPFKANEEKKVEEKSVHDYQLYLLPDNKPETIAEAHMEIMGGSAVLLYPADLSSDSKEKEYNACFIRKGSWVQKNGQLKTAALGPLNLENKNRDAIIQMALSKAGIIQDPTIIGQDTMRHVTSSFLDISSLAAYSICSRRSNQDVRPQLYKKACAKLLQHIIRGEKDQAEAMLERASKLKDNTLLSALLLGEDTVNSFSFGLDRNNPIKVRGTPLKVALIANDVDVIIDGKKVVDGMAEMIMSYLMKLPNGLAEIGKQIKEQAPDEKEEEEHCLRDIEALNKMVKAIEDATDDECEQALSHDAKEDNPVEAALNEFRNYLEPRKNEVITTGKQFNEKILQHAFKLYDEKYATFGDGGDSPKNILCWRKIIGYIQRFSPASTAEVFCHGLYSVVEDREELKRSLKFRYDNVSFFPLDLNLLSRLGYDCAARLGTTAVTSCLAVCSPARLLHLASFSKLMSSKNCSVAKYYAATRQAAGDSVFSNVGRRC